ncbi:MAG: dynamin family protein [Acutalibacteraceae bacterium]
MVKKRNYLELIEKLDEICTAYELKTLSDDNRTISSSINDFVVHVLLMGGFSAGKSSLLNTFMGRDILPEDQAEKTAIATELLYDEKEYIEAVSEESTVTYTLEEIDSIDADKYEYLRVHINNDFLRELDGIRIVDMPGLDSKIENHNKAIMKYVGKGNAYLLCVECTNGTLNASTSRFINEIKQYKNSLVLAVTKCDKKPEDQVTVIADNVQCAAENAFGEKIQTFAVSVYDEDICEKRKNIVAAFDAQNLFEQAFSGSIKNNAELCISALNSIKKNSNSSSEEIDEKIESIERAKKELDRNIKREKQSLSKKFTNEVKPKIMAEVENALHSNSGIIASAARNGSEDFSRTVNEIVRPVLINATQQYSEEAFSVFVAEKNMIPSVSDDFADKLTAGYNALSGRVNSFLEKQPKDDDGNFSGKYKTVASLLAIMSDKLDPMIEVVLVFLPEILGFINHLFERSRENEFSAKIENEVIPQVVFKIGESLQPILDEMQANMLDTLTEKYELECNSIKEATENLNTEKKNKQMELQEYISKLDSDIASAQEIIKELSC